MEEIYLGLDLCKKNIQISYFCEDKQEPESIYQLNNTETYQLPNDMFYSEREKKWYVGNDVSMVCDREEGILIADVVGSIDSPICMVVGDREYTYEELLFILLKTHVEEFISRSEEYSLCGMTVSLETYHPKVYQVLYKLKGELKLSKDSFYVMSHENAFFQYVMNQDEKLRINSVAMFEYGISGMKYYRLDKKRQGNTEVYYLNRQDMGKELPYVKLSENVEELDKCFAEIARIKMRETYISAAYLTGAGFSDDWIEKSKGVLCEGRKVFMGQNIYTKGACYHAKSGAYEDGKDCVFCTEGSIPFDIGVGIGDEGGRNQFYPIAIGGREWYNMNGKAALFLDDTKRIDLIYRDKITKQMQKEIVEIHGLPKRPPKTTKLSLEIELHDEKLGAIVIRDVGFGKIYPTTNKIYRKEFSVKSEVE